MKSNPIKKMKKEGDQRESRKGEKEQKTTVFQKSPIFLFGIGTF